MVRHRRGSRRHLSCGCHDHELAVANSDGSSRLDRHRRPERLAVNHHGGVAERLDLHQRVPAGQADVPATLQGRSAAGRSRRPAPPPAMRPGARASLGRVRVAPTRWWQYRPVSVVADPGRPVSPPGHGAGRFAPTARRREVLRLAARCRRVQCALRGDGRGCRVLGPTRARWCRASSPLAAAPAGRRRCGQATVRSSPGS